MGQLTCSYELVAVPGGVGGGSSQGRGLDSSLWWLWCAEGAIAVTRLKLPQPKGCYGGTTRGCELTLVFPAWRNAGLLLIEVIRWGQGGCTGVPGQVALLGEEK